MAQHGYAFSGNAAALRMWVAENPSKIDQLSADRQTSLLYTCSRFGHLDLVKYLVENGANVNVQNGENKSTPLHGACFGGHHEVVAYLMSMGADAKKKNAYKELPSHNATEPAEGVTAAATNLCLDAIKNPPPPPSAAKKETSASPAKAAEPAVDPAAVAKWSALSLVGLRNACKENSLSAAGTKAAMAARLAAVKPEGPTAKPKEDAPAPAVEDAPPAKKEKTEEAAPVVAAPAAPAAETETKEENTNNGCFTAEWTEKLRNATFTQTQIEKDTEAFWDLEEKVMAWNQGRNDDYVKNRLKKKLKPLTFILKNAWKINNPTLEAAFNEKKKEMMEQRGEARIRVAFHGSRPANLDSINKTSLLRFKHPLNPCKTQADDGYFGTNKKGVYVSRYFDYTLKYSNGLKPIGQEDTCKILMFKCLPGKSKHIEALTMGMEPTEGHDSHSSPSHLEWYLFDERQLCPDYVLEIQAKEDTRTAADDE